MCLLVTQPEGTVFTEAFLNGVYQLNSDGIGVMYAEDNTLFIKKFVPKTATEFLNFFEDNIQGRDCAWHARMRTHGHIDLHNCHPYEVLSEADGHPLYLAHNGVLATGNRADIAKSDTWHYIQDYLRPLLLRDPSLMLDPAFIKLIENHIGSGNKFVMLNAHGEMVTLNKQQGVEYNGAWLSNTYAWDTKGTEHDYMSRSTYSFNGSKNYGAKYGGRIDRVPYSSYQPYSGFGAGLNADGEEWGDTGTGSERFPYTHDDPVGVSPEEIENEAWESDNTYIVDFVCSFFEALEDMGLDSSGISYDAVENYFNHVGFTLGWQVIDAIDYGAYTQAEIELEIYSYMNEPKEEVATAPVDGVLLPKEEVTA